MGVNLAEPSGTSVIDGRGMIVMPGFVDTHEHPGSPSSAGALPTASLGWLARCKPDQDEPVQRGETYAAVRLPTVGLIDYRRDNRGRLVDAIQPRFVRGNLRALNDSSSVTRSP